MKGALSSAHPDQSRYSRSIRMGPTDDEPRIKRTRGNEWHCKAEAGAQVKESRRQLYEKAKRRPCVMKGQALRTDDDRTTAVFGQERIRKGLPPK